MSEKQTVTPTVPATMDAVRLHAPSDPARLEFERVATPQPGSGEALVRVFAAAITRGELDWPADRLPAIPSYEFSGVVAALGPDADDVAIGEYVYALSGFDRDGAAAEYIIIPSAFLAPKPRTLGHVESAAIPLAALTAWQALFDHGGLAAGERVLIHGAAGGVGGVAVQLAHGRGAYVIGTTSTKNIETARQLGADEVVDHTNTRFEGLVETVDFVFDTVGGDTLERSLAALRRGCILVSIAAEPSQERAAERGITAVYFVVKPIREQLVKITKLVDNRNLPPTVDQVFPLADARSAFKRSLERGHRGKIVLRVSDDAPAR